MLLIDGRAFKLCNVIWDGDDPKVLLCECLERRKGEPQFFSFDVDAAAIKKYSATRH